MSDMSTPKKDAPAGPRPSLSEGPLAGVKVLDLSRILAAPTCTQLLGDLGADVWKVEKPGAGDDTRAWGPPYLKDANGAETGESAYYLSSNRNKRSIAVDIAAPDGAALIRRLASEADILIENFKTGDLARYGLDYASLSAAYPRLVYCSVTGFGQTGPNAKRAGYDLMAQGAAGIMSITGDPDGGPTKVGVGIADVMCGMYAAVGLLAALRHRDATGEGQHIDLALVDATMAWTINEGVNTLISGVDPVRRGNQHPNIAPYQDFAARDGHLLVAVGNDAQFRRFVRLLGAERLADDPRFVTNQSRLANREAMIAALTPLIAAWDKEALAAAMASEGVPGGPILTLTEMFASDQAAARDMVVSVPHKPAGVCAPLIGNPLKLSRTPVAYRRAPPVRGQHSAEIIAEVLGDAALAQARAAGVIEEAEPKEAVAGDAGPDERSHDRSQTSTRRGLGRPT